MSNNPIRLAVTVALLMATTAKVPTTFAEEDPTEATLAAAEQANVDPEDLQGALNSISTATGVQVDPKEYLYGIGELKRPEQPAEQSTPTGWPIAGPLGQRIYCVEGIESHHGLLMYNPHGWPPPLYQYHAQGWLGWLPPTAADAGAIIGNRTSEWNAAARMILGQVRGHKGSEFYGIGAGIC